MLHYSSEEWSKMLAGNDEFAVKVEAGAKIMFKVL